MARMVVIEMNPRVSRSSALASKATGFPIAKIAARLAVGYTLDEIVNDITNATPASFEPTIDYVVTKVPRWAFEKFPGIPDVLGTRMQSVGEAMAIGRTFPESLQKALRSLEHGRLGLNCDPAEAPTTPCPMTSWCGGPPSPPRTAPSSWRRPCAGACRWNGCTAPPGWTRGSWTRRLIVEGRAWLTERGGRALDGAWTRGEWRRAKRLGFSRRPAGVAVAGPRGVGAGGPVGLRGAGHLQDRRHLRGRVRGPHAVSLLHLRGHRRGRPGERPKVIILGSGPNRIGQGVEFDYCCVQASFALHEAGFETVMVNCNPETVSTDYDTSDRLYFEPLTWEDVTNVIEAEQRSGPVHGVIVALGGQTPAEAGRPAARRR